MSKLELVNELHRAARRNFVRRRTQMRGINDTLQADLVEMIPYAAQNRRINYILTAINIFSKKAYACPVKNKSGKEVKRALESILNTLGHPIKNIHTDRGKEFYNKDVRTMLCQRKIHLYSTHSTMKAAICERFNRTLKNKMWKLFSLRGSYKWIDILPKLISEYNDTKHRTIGMRPNDVNKHNEQMHLDDVYNHTVNTTTTPRNRQKFRVGDRVRLSKYKHAFEKGYTPNWTTEVFKIRKIQFTQPTTYLLEDLQGDPIDGTVYAEELLLSKCADIYLVEKVLKQRGDKLYVKWLGFGNEFNEWINKRDYV